MIMGPWGLAILHIVVWGYGIQQGDWILVSLVLAVGHVSRTKVTQYLVLPSCICFWVWVSFSLSQHYPVTVCVGGQPDLKWGNRFLSRQPQKSQFTREEESSTVVGFHRAREYTTCSLIRKRWIFCTGLSVSPSLQGGTFLLETGSALTLSGTFEIRES